MKKIGAIGIILGLLFLSLEIYGFRIIQALEEIYGKWMTNAWGYAGESLCVILALVLTLVVILFSIYLFFTDGKN